MLTVRFPNGFSIQYNRANYLKYGVSFAELYTAKDGDWVASVAHSSGAVIEPEEASRCYNPIDEKLRERLFAIEHELRNQKRNLSKLLKEKK